MRTAWLGGLLATMAGCVVVEHSEELDELSFDQPIEAVVADLGAGNLTVEVGGGEASVSRSVRYTGEPPHLDAWVEGGTLFLEVRCRPLQRVCAVDHHLVLPQSASLDADLGSGNLVASDLSGVLVDIGSGSITLSEVSGDVDLSTGSGRVSVDGVTGRLTIDGGSGDIEVRGANVVEAHAHTGSGAVDLELVEVPSAVSVEVGSGAVDLAVPAGRYRIEAETGSGQLTIDGITADRDADASIRVEAGSGDVRIVGR